MKLSYKRKIKLVVMLPKVIHLRFIISFFILSVFSPFTLFAQEPIPAKDTLTALVKSDTVSVKSDTATNPIVAPILVNPIVSVDTTIKVAKAKPETSKLLHKKFEAKFDSTSIELNPKIQFISNILKVENTNGTPKEFSVDVLCPKDWIVLKTPDVIYTLTPGDSLFIPIRVIPSKKSMRGGSLYFINVFITGTDGTQLASALFKVSKPNKVFWQMDILPSPRVYFLNNQIQVPFGASLANNGEEKQNVNFSVSQVGEYLAIKDTNNKELKKHYFDVALAPTHDTTFNFLADVKDIPRNFRNVDLENHNASASFESRKYTVFMKAIEPKISVGNSSGKKKIGGSVNLNKHIDFIRLRDKVKVNEYGSAVIPMIFESNVYNILGTQPVATTLFRSNTQINQFSGINFFLQNTFTYYTPSKNSFQQTSLQLGYYNRNLMVSAGDVGGLMGIGGIGGNGGGKGVSASYSLKKSMVSAFYSRSPVIFGAADYQNYGLGYRITPIEKVQLSIGATRRESLKTPSDNSTLFTDATFAILKNSSFHLGYGLTIIRDSISFPSLKTKLSNSINAGVNNSFLKNRLSQSIYATYSDLGDINYSNKNLGVYVNHKFSPSAKKYSLALNNYYNSNSYQYRGIANNVISFTNQFLLIKRQSNGISYSPGLFYNYFEQSKSRLHFRGLSLNYSYFNYKKNTRASFNILGGYNNYLDSTNNRELFGLQFFGMLQYHTFKLSMAYNYGPTGIGIARSIVYSAYNYPQTFRTTLNYEYLFKDRRFVLNLPLNYSYNNLFGSHTVSINPQLYFFTYNGWRLRFDVNYAYGRSNPHSQLKNATYATQINTEGVSDKPTQSHLFTLGAGVRKEFGIPIPKKWSKKAFSSATFKAFLDFNGNHKIDKDEIPLENIVIRLADNEVLTNDLGEGLFQNTPTGRYYYVVFSLVDLEGWFYQHDDSLMIDGSKIYYVPYSKGVKVFGSVVFDREKVSSDIQKDIDISRFKISVTDSAGKTQTTLTDSKGEFSFYVPYGKYVLSMDEKELGDQFTLAQNNYPIELSDGMDNYYNSFYVIERRRKIMKKKFGADGSISSSIEEEGVSAKSKKTAPVVPKKTKNLPPKPLSKTAKDSIQNMKLQKIQAKKDSVQRTKFMKDSVQNFKLQKIKASKDSVQKAKLMKDSLKKESQKLINKIEQENLESEDMASMHEIDSLVDALLSKPDSTVLSDADIAKVEARSIKKSFLSNYQERELYFLQIGAFKGALPIEALVKFLKSKQKVESFVDKQDGLTKYFIGNYTTWEEATEAKKELKANGLTGAFVIGIYHGDVVTAEELFQLRKEK